MNVFGKFAVLKEKVKGFRETYSDYQQTQDLLEPYVKKTTQELKDVIKEFEKAELLSGVAQVYERNLAVQEVYFGVKQIFFDTKGLLGPEHIPDGPIEKHVKEIVAAAQEKGIAVVYTRNANMGLKNHHDNTPTYYDTPTIEVSKSIKEEDGAKILLQALAAYAEKKGKPKLAELATAAADRMELLTKKYSALRAESVSSVKSR